MRKKGHYDSLDEKHATDNNIFWKMVTPSLSFKTCKSSKVTLIEKYEFMNKNPKINFDVLNGDNILIF